jgi:UDP-N-acetylmuramoyl-L-alanyl-D-glutamate--2,6-diaminopimelate ligase
VKLAALLPEDDADGRYASVEVTGVAADSRKVKPGNVFFAIAGAKADGAAYVRDAVKAGAAIIAAERNDFGDVPVLFAKVKNARRALALAAAAAFPRQPATIAAVTGTSGKTSVAAFTRQIWAALGQPAASLGTIGVVSPSGETYGSLTTPDPVDLHRTLDTLAGEGVTHLALEASSHGLDQHRLDGVRISAGAFTNLSRDHLDYHPDVEAYLAAKLRLFTELLPPGSTAVIDVDNCYAGQVIAAAKTRGLKIDTVGEGGDGIRLTGGAIDGFAQNISFLHEGRARSVKLPLVGAFQVHNVMVAAALALATGSDPDAVFGTLEHLTGARGRLELVGARNGAPIFIDYAHKPDALAKALDALRPYASGRLVVVFGCGGDRDKGKRPLMGAIATEKADTVIVTDDNPRSENPAAIRAEILAAAPGATEIGDRGEAIRTAIAGLKAGDALMVAGKGHETGQIVGSKVLPFSDHDAVAAALKETA